LWRFIHHLQISQNRSKIHAAMNPRKHANRFVAILVLAAFGWVLVLSVAPGCHERIHSDANRVEHSCAVTFIVAGNYEHTSNVLAIKPALPVSVEQVARAAQAWVPSPFLSAGLLEHAPPAHS
jgi:hypothetical protein